MAERTPAGDNPVPLSPDNAATASSARLTTVAPPRITRSSARQAASQVAQTSAASNPTKPISDSADLSTSPKAPPLPPRNKRKASVGSKLPATTARPGSSDRRSKRQKLPEDTATTLPLSANTKAPSKAVRKGKTSSIMDPSNDRTGLRESTHDHSASDNSNRRGSRSKKPTHSPPVGIPDEHSPLSRRSKRLAGEADEDIIMGGTEGSREEPESVQHASANQANDDDENEDTNNKDYADEHHDDEDDDDEDDDDENDRGDAFGDHEDGDPFGAFGAAGLSNTLRALTGMMSGQTSRLRELLNSLREDDLSVQVIALQELSEFLLVSNEDNLAGHFSPDAFVRELVQLMNKEESPEVMLLACRCLANLMEALPASVANVVYGNAVPVLCSKLLEISFIDLAEQSLSTLEKISVEYPASIVREGGLTACLSYLDFFATSTQRTAVTIAANCCRNIPDDSFPVVRDVMPILLNVLSSNDQRVVEQASLCVSGIVESFKHQASKLEELVSVDLLRAVLRLLVPGTTNLIGSNIHTQFLRVLAFTARASPRLSAELFKLQVVETLYQILTGVSPPSGIEDVASKLDSVVIMQALIHRPREQIIETLNVICELLPGLPKDADPLYGDFVEFHGLQEPIAAASSSRQSPAEKRLSLLNDCKDEVRRFALIIFPTLTDVFSSTVNLSVRQKVLQAQIKMLSNLHEKILEESLVPVPYASFLASILSQQDHPSLVMLGLQATELLLSRLDRIYRYQLYREGVIFEIESLSTQALEESSVEDPTKKADGEHGRESSPTSEDEDDEEDDEDHDDEGDGDDGEEALQAEQEHAEPETAEPEDDEDADHDDQEQDDDASSGSTSASEAVAPPRRYLSDSRTTKTRICQVAKRFLESHENEEHGRDMKAKASLIMDGLKKLADELEAFFLRRTSIDLSSSAGKALFTQLAAQFDTDVLESVTSAELLSSGLVRSLVEVLSNPDEALARLAQSTFLEVFMGKSIKSKPKTATAESPATPFSMMIHKLQDLLSRSEHYEVVTVHHNTFDGNRTSPASMLGKQIRLRLVADDDSNIPRSYRNIMVSIHAIATFRSLDEYLRPRISISERPRIARRDGLTQALAAMAGLPLSGAPPGSRLADGSPFAPGSVPLPPPPPPLAGMPPSASHLRRAVSNKPPRHPTTPTNVDQAGGPSRSGKSLRRSSRRQVQPSGVQSPANPPPDDEGEQSTLECADEKQISEDDEDLADASALDAIVGELEDMDEEPDAPGPDDPSAIDFEVATTGGVTARKEDGTKVATPISAEKRPAEQRQAPATSTPAGPSRPMSYASAVQAVPQDWHIEFSLDNKVISNETTIYHAIFMAATKTEDQHISRSIWSATHPIKFKRVPGPPGVEPTAVTANTEAESQSPDGIPASLAKNPTTASILRLLNIMHELNENIEDVLITNDQTIGLNVEPPSQFVSTKLTAKLNRQLEEPLIVASRCLPSWSEDLARLYPFLFPFETRHLFLQSTSFGYARSMARWQNAQAEENRRDRHNERPFLGRLQRQKVRISRLKILESALKVMELYGASQSILEVEYFEEVGTGLGPTLEFYSTVSKEFAKKKLRLWRDIDNMGSDEFVSGPSGLFPRPLGAEELGTPNGERILHLFKMLGKFIARSMIDSRIIDIHFNPTFFRISDAAAAGVKPSLGAVKVVDPGLARSLKAIKKYSIAKKEIDEDPTRTPAQKVADTENISIDSVRLDDLCLDFTLPGYPGIELETNGSQKRVTIDNVDVYLDKVIDMTLGSGVRAQVDAFRTGFSQVFPYTALSAFTPAELVTLFGKVNEDWSLETLTDSIKADHGFNMDSRSVKNLLQVMSEFDLSERREFLQFITGSPKLPIGGFRSLTPMFTVVCKPSEHPYTSDDYLPSVMTCVNYLKLPDYTDHDTMRKRLVTAMKEGQGAFHLS